MKRKWPGPCGVALVLILGAGLVLPGAAWATNDAGQVGLWLTDEAPPLLASRPNQGLIDFLRSPLGVIASGAFVLGTGLASGAAFLSRLRPNSQPTRKRRSRGRHRRKPEPAPPLPSSSHYQALAGAAISAGCLLLPLVFAIALNDVFALPKTVLLLLVAAVVGIAVVVAAKRGARPVRLGIADLALGAFLLLTLAATILSVDPDHSMLGERYQYQGLLSIAAYVVLFTGARFALAAPAHVRVLSAALLIAAVIASIYALAQWVGLDPIWSELFKRRVFSTMGQANALAAVLATAVVMTLPLAVGRRSLSRTVLGFAVALMVAAFALTFGRAGYVALAAGSTATALVCLPLVSWGALRPHVPKIIISLPTVAVVLLALSLTWQPAREVLTRTAARVASTVDPAESSNRIRLDLWRVGLTIATEHPVLGTGPDSYVIVFPRYRDQVLSPDRAAHMAQFRPESPHNVYIAVADGQGIPALVAYLIIIGSSLVLGVRAARSKIPMPTRLALAALVGAVVVNLVTESFMTAEPASTAIFWVVLGSLAGLASGIVNGSAAMEQP